LLHALEAKPRTGRPLVDSGRREEIAQLLARVDEKLNHES
jgi:hypothetical protein